MPLWLVVRLLLWFGATHRVRNIQKNHCYKCVHIWVCTHVATLREMCRARKKKRDKESGRSLYISKFSFDILSKGDMCKYLEINYYMPVRAQVWICVNTLEINRPTQKNRRKCMYGCRFGYFMILNEKKTKRQLRISYDVCLENYLCTFVHKLDRKTQSLTQKHA